MSEQNLIIDVHHLSKNFSGKPAVIDVSLEVKRGRICGFLGPNGSGKTTTIRMLCGLITPDAGSGTCLGYDILTETRQIKKHIGYIPQFFGLYEQLTVYENLMLISELYGVIDRKRKITSIMDQLELGSRKNQCSGTLSGGWKQRLSLAAALIHDPLLLILDEPTASVDPKSRHDFWELMYDFSSAGMTVLLSSHNMDEVERCHQISYICNGRLLLNGTIREVIKQVKMITWKVTGDNLPVLAKQLQVIAGIDQVTTFYDALHVSGMDRDKLDAAIKPYINNPNFKWEPIESLLEDVFIWLSRQTTHSREEA